MAISNVAALPVSPLPSPGTSTRAQAQEAVQQERSTQPIIQSTAANLERFVFNRKLQFVVDHNSNQVMVKVIDKDTDKVIRVLPPEELQRMQRSLRDSGVLFDERV
jgi:flagellar protein FlaG